MVDTVISHLFLLCVPVFLTVPGRMPEWWSKKKERKKNVSARSSARSSLVQDIMELQRRLELRGSVFKTARVALAKTDLN